jgi:hypothetical protein
VRQGYETGRNELTSDPKDCDEIDQRLEHASGVALLLRSNIVQGELQPGKTSKENTATVDPGDSVAQSEVGGVYSKFYGFSQNSSREEGGNSGLLI